MMSLAWPLFRVTNRQRWLPGRKPDVATKIKLMPGGHRDAPGIKRRRFSWTSIIGEGEIDHAPMLWIGEEVGKAMGQKSISRLIPLKARGWCDGAEQCAGGHGFRPSR